MAHTIVVFDDSLNHLRLFESILTRHGYHIIGHRGAFRGAEQFDGRTPSLIILGYIRGFTPEEVVALQLIRDNLVSASVPILIATTGAYQYNRTSIPWPAVSIINKPFDARELIAAVDNALSLRPITDHDCE